MKGITILGSTGSIGVNTLDVVSRHKDKYELIALTANKEVNRLKEQCIAWRPRYAVMADIECAERLELELELELENETEVPSQARIGPS